MAKWTHLRMRFPPFDAPSHIPSEMKETVVHWPSKSDDTSLSIGDDNGWFIRRELVNEVPKGSKLVEEVDSSSATQNLLATRSGWALSPHPLHSIARKLIPYGVMILILAIVLHVLEPVLIRWGIMSEAFAGSINIGLLDYPIMFVMAAPFVVIPLILRVVANVEDIRRQHRFKDNPPSSPRIKVDSAFAEGPVSVIVELSNSLSKSKITGQVRVGLLPPHRNAMMAAHIGNLMGRPPVGLSTPLPDGWMPVADDGSGIGETTPMVVGRGPARLFQEPMRIQVSGPKKDIESGTKHELETPEGPWPGCEYGGYVNINWELALKFVIKGRRPLYWVEKLNVKSGKSHSVPHLLADSGRLEST